MACEFEILLSGEERQHLVDVADLALDDIARLDEQLSRFISTSEVSYLNFEAAKHDVIVEPGLFELLRLAKQAWFETDGAFDVTAGPVVDLWREAERSGNEPGMQAINDALAKVGMEHVLLDEEKNSVRFDIDGVRIDLGAMGKGYAVARAASILKEYDIESALISGGRSTLCAIGDEGWNVGIRHPSKLDERVTSIMLRNQAMSTSGGPAQRDAEAEERFEHIIDPRTGMPAESGAVSVSVITDDAALSDVLSTAFYVRGQEFAEAYCKMHPIIKAIFVAIDCEGQSPVIKWIGGADG